MHSEMNSTIAKLEQELADLEALADMCERQVLRVEEAKTALSKNTEMLTSLLDSKSIAFRRFERRTQEQALWWEQTLSGYVSPSNCTYVKERVAILRDVLNELQPEFLRDTERPKSQYFVSDGDLFRAQSTIFRLMKRASKRLAIVDTYLDDTIFDYVASLDETLQVTLLTGTRIRLFPKLLSSFVQNRPNLEARECSLCHDRFIIIDCEKCARCTVPPNHSTPQNLSVLSPPRR